MEGAGELVSERWLCVSLKPLPQLLGKGTQRRVPIGVPQVSVCVALTFGIGFEQRHGMALDVGRGALLLDGKADREVFIVSESRGSRPGFPTRTSRSE